MAGSPEEIRHDIRNHLNMITLTLETVKYICNNYDTVQDVIKDGEKSVSEIVNILDHWSSQEQKKSKKFAMT